MKLQILNFGNNANKKQNVHTMSNMKFKRICAMFVLIIMFKIHQMSHFVKLKPNALSMNITI